MLFKITFVSNDKELPILYVKSRYLGFDAIDKAINKLIELEIECDEINNYVHEWKEWDYSTFLDLEDTRKIDLFRFMGHIIVTVPPYAFNQYIIAKTDVVDKELQLTYALDVDTLLETWLKDGQQLSWKL